MLNIIKYILKRICFFDEFNVTKLIRPYVVGTRYNDGAQDIPIENTFLDESHIPFMSIGSKYAYEYPGTGIAAIAYAILDCKFDVVNIVGLDFYDNLFCNENTKNPIILLNADRILLESRINLNFSINHP